MGNSSSSNNNNNNNNDGNDKKNSSTSTSTFDDKERKYWLSRVTNKISRLELLDKDTWYGMRLKDAPKFIQNDKEIVLTATYNSFGAAFEFASPELQQDKDFVLQVVQQYRDGFALEFVSPELQQDKQVVMAAVKSTLGGSFKYASPELRQDKDFVLQIVQQRGLALQYVSPELQNNKQVVMAAINQEPDAIRYAHKDLKRDPDVLIAAGMFDDDHDTTKNTRKIVFSTRFALNESTYSLATDFTRRFKKSKFYQDGDFIVYSPNAFDKKTCDKDWTNFDHPCRGTADTCNYSNKLTHDGRPTDDCCWRYSFRSQLQEAKNTGGFMVQLIETEPTVREKFVKDATLGNGQKIELDMANTIGVKVFHVYCPEFEKDGRECVFGDRHVDVVTAEIARWYDDDDDRCQDMSVTYGLEWGFQDRHVDVVTAEIARWYDDDDDRCQDMSVTVIRQFFY